MQIVQVGGQCAIVEKAADTIFPSIISGASSPGNSNLPALPLSTCSIAIIFAGMAETLTTTFVDLPADTAV